MNSDQVQQPERQLTMQRVPLGDLADIFSRRKIAVASDRNGQVVLVRPDRVLFDVQRNEGRRAGIAAVVARFDEEQARRIADLDPSVFPPDRLTDIVTIELKARRSAGKEGDWTLAAVDEFIDAASAAGLEVEYDHVFIGDQGMTGSPLGVSVEWVGEMAFPGQTATSVNGSKVLLNTAMPADEPPFLRQPLRLGDRRRPQVLVLDTGLRTTNAEGKMVEHDKLRDVVSVRPDWQASNEPLAVDDEDEPDVDGTETLDFEAGHGTFISGIIRQLCPDAEIHTAGVLTSFGDGSVSTVLRGLERSIKQFGTLDIVVFSLGGNFADDDPGTFAPTLTALLGDALGIAAAGNQRTCRPYFPAALHDIIGVGGLAADGRAWFSNFGGWVDASAPAVDVVSTFFVNESEHLEDRPARSYEGWARWSGTSFSAPKVAALIAQEMYLNLNSSGDDLISAREAWKRLTSYNHLRMPDLGIVFNV